MTLQGRDTIRMEETFQQIKFSINGKNYSVGSNVPPSTSLLRYIREFANLPGTKALCYEGGCGICTVVVTTYDLETGGQKTFSLKSCQTLVYACSGWAIETIEHLGNRHKGYHTLQKALVGFYGTQCGYCSPGFIMTMYGELKSAGKLTTEQVEKSLDGNLCRCTGYRPILDAFKSLAVDAPKELKNKLADIEDSYKSVCPNSGKLCRGTCSHSSESESCQTKGEMLQESMPLNEIALQLKEVRWYRPIAINGIYRILQKVEKDSKLRFVVGNTGEGVFKDDGPHTIYVDTTGVSDLYSVGTGSPLTIGANVSLQRCIQVFRQMAKSYSGFRYLEEIAKHWDIVANVGIRNVGSWAGNLMLKHAHRDFPSDIFVTLAVIDATVLVGHSADSSTSEVSVEELLDLDMTKSIILSMKIPVQDEKTFIRTYKITPRAVNAHAYVNAAFKFKVDSKDGFKLLEKPAVIFGGINPLFVHADNTEKFLTGRRLGVSGVIAGALKKLEEELVPDNKPQDASPLYRKTLALALVYKAILHILGEKVSPEMRSGGSLLVRPISSGQQKYDANEDSWPVGKAIPKLESDIQVAGEAEYVDDMEPLSRELHGAFVQSTIANAKIKSVDPSAALAVSGVVAYVDAKDIPGPNSFFLGAFPDPIFAASEVSYAGQPIGLIVADRRDVAVRAAKLVKVEYSDLKKPILTIKEALNNKLPEFTHDFKGAKHVLQGELEQGSQFHLTMEPLTSRVIPVEDGYDVFCCTQWLTETQTVLANVLGISSNSINMSVKRLGGGYGGKISRVNLVCCAAGIAAKKLQCPVRVTLDLQSHMTLVGWRDPYLSTYKVSFDDEGILQDLEVHLISDAGSVSNEVTSGYAFSRVPNVYVVDKFIHDTGAVNTTTAANTYCRTPGTPEAVATMENIIEHIASYLNKDPLEIREKNFMNREKDKTHRTYGPKGENLVRTKIFPALKEQSNYIERRKAVEAFNKENRWTKRGLSMMPLFYRLGIPPVFRYGTQVAIYEEDGTIVLSHGGVEMGQGINTKAAQIAAKTLNAPIEYIKVKPTNLVTGANSSVTGGSFGSDLIAHGFQKCCQMLFERMDKVAKRMKKRTNRDPKWEELVKRCFNEDVDLSERYWTSTSEHPKSYDIFASICMEVEVDVLTGQYMILRTDVIEDCGKSMSPFVDIGQVEGSLIMGLGFYTSEVVKYNPATGEKLSNGTWEYKVPTALDIPTDLRISFMANGDNEFGVARSKATGEPAVCLAYCVVTALRHAIQSARSDAGDPKWFEITTPVTVERVQQLCKVDPSQFVLRKKEDVEDILNDFHIVEKSDVPPVEEASCAVN